jgi:quercetin dioxygenase-like cupin family protein
VVIAPGENHWHGAAAGRTMVHLAMQENDDSGKNVVWGRQVSEEEYLAAGTPLPPT